MYFWYRRSLNLLHKVLEKSSVEFHFQLTVATLCIISYDLVILIRDYLWPGRCLTGFCAVVS